MPQNRGEITKDCAVSALGKHCDKQSCADLNLGSFVGQSTSLEAHRLQEAQVCSCSTMLQLWGAPFLGCALRMNPGAMCPSLVPV